MNVLEIVMKFISRRDLRKKVAKISKDVEEIKCLVKTVAKEQEDFFDEISDQLGTISYGIHKNIITQKVIQLENEMNNSLREIKLTPRKKFKN